jgi:hypothetical protein
MSWEQAVGAAIGSAAGSLFGGSKGPSLGKQLEYQWRNVYEHPTYAVKGAKKAGVHPLYYLGNTPNWTPSVPVGQHESGSALGESIGRAAGALTEHHMTKGARAKQQLAQERQQGANLAATHSRAAADQAQANYYNSLAKRTEQMVNSQQDQAALLSFGEYGTAQAPTQAQTKTPIESKIANKHTYKMPFGGMEINVPPGTPTDVIEQHEGEAVGLLWSIMRGLAFPSHTDWSKERQNAVRKLKKLFDKHRRRSFVPKGQYYYDPYTGGP